MSAAGRRKKGREGGKERRRDGRKDRTYRCRIWAAGSRARPRGA
jgi:hypothetical protein